MRATVHLGIIDSLEAFAECHKTKLSLADVATEAPVMVELAGAGFEALHGINFFAAAAASHTRTRVSILAGRHRQDDFLGIRFCGIVDGVGVVVIFVIARRFLVAFLHVHRSAERHDPPHRR